MTAGLDNSREESVQMKFKAILLALAVAGASASLAFAEDGPHSGTTTSTTAEASTTDRWSATASRALTTPSDRR